VDPAAAEIAVKPELPTIGNRNGCLRIAGCDQGIDFFIRGTDLEAARANSWMLGHQLDRVFQVVGLQEHDAAQLLLGFGVRTIGDENLPASPAAVAPPVAAQSRAWS
jgi:hypothetical protein